MEQLQYFALNPPETEDEVRAMATLPRPWDLATCCGRLRSELWDWLEDVAAWINEQHLWNTTPVGIPECWPAHPHIVHDLSAVACARYDTSFAYTPNALDQWHRHTLAPFLDRLAYRLGDGCQPGRHAQRPRVERDRHFQGSEARGTRRGMMKADLGEGGLLGTENPP